MANDQLKADSNTPASKRIGHIQSLYRKYFDYARPDLERAITNARMYWHIDFGQWPKEVVDKLVSEGRRPPTIPVIPDKIETLVGSILSNGFDIEFQASEPTNDDKSLSLQDMYYSDQNCYHWEDSETEALLNSTIYAGFERMKVVNDENPFGHIAWESLNPRHILLNPSWKSNDIKDLTDYIVFNDLLPTQIMDMWPSAKEKLLQQWDEDRADYGTNTGAVDDLPYEKKWGSYHRVIEYHYLVKQQGYWEWDKRNGCFFPDTGFKQNSNEDRLAKMGYAQKVGLGPDEIAMVPRTWKEAHIEIVVPSLSSEVFLSEGLDPVQTGNVNLYPLGLRYNGQFQGVVVDRLYDLQIAINRGEMNRQDIMTRSAKGAFILDEAIVDGDEEKKREIEQGWNDPAARFWVTEGSTKNLPGGGIIGLPTSNIPFDQHNVLGQYYDMSDRFSKVPSAMSGVQETAKESGKLFRYKFEAGTIAQKYLMKIYEKHKRNKAEAYLAMSKTLYSNGTRVFSNTKSGKTVLINTSNHDKFDALSLARIKVNIVPSPNGISVRNEQRNEFGEILSMLVGPNDALLRTIVVGKTLMLAEMPEKDRNEIEKAVSLMKIAYANDLAAHIAQTQQALQPAPQMPPGGQAIPNASASPEQQMLPEPNTPAPM